MFGLFGLFVCLCVIYLVSYLVSYLLPSYDPMLNSNSKGSAGQPVGTPLKTHIKHLEFRCKRPGIDGTTDYEKGQALVRCQISQKSPPSIRARSNWTEPYFFKPV